MMPPAVIQIRQSLCSGRCRANPLDPCAACENGHWGRYEQKGCNDGTQRMGLGDRIASIAQPIARRIDKTFGTNITTCGGCKKAQQRLNAGQPIILTIIKRLKGD